jgi:hypothetical protein
MDHDLWCNVCYGKVYVVSVRIGVSPGGRAVEVDVTACGCPDAVSRCDITVTIVRGRFRWSSSWARRLRPESLPGLASLPPLLGGI